MSKTNTKEQKETNTEKKQKSKKTVNKNKPTAKKETTPKKDPLAELEEKYQQINDKYLRLTAEFDNYRKRTLKERMELIKNAGEDILLKILPLSTDFDRGLKSINEAAEIEAVKKGMELIYNKYNDFLKSNGIKEIEAINKDFDTDVHEAITKIPAPSKDMKGKVVDVIEKGYFLNEKVIRFAKVVVGE